MTPTEEVTQLPINGAQIPARVWRGTTEAGVELDVYVLSIVPTDPLQVPILAGELPKYMMPSRLAMHIHLTGEEPPDA